MVYFIQSMFENKDDSLEGKNIMVSGSNNVAQFAIDKLDLYMIKMV